MDYKWYLERTEFCKMKFLDGHLKCTGNLGYCQLLKAQVCRELLFDNSIVDAAVGVILKQSGITEKTHTSLIHGYLVEKDGKCFLYEGSEQIACLTEGETETSILLKNKDEIVGEIIVGNNGKKCSSIFDRITYPFAEITGIKLGSRFYSREKFYTTSKNLKIGSISIEGLYLKSMDYYPCDKILFNKIELKGAALLDSKDCHGFIIEGKDGSCNFVSYKEGDILGNYTSKVFVDNRETVANGDDREKYRVFYYNDEEICRIKWNEAGFYSGLFGNLCTFFEVKPFVKGEYFSNPWKNEPIVGIKKETQDSAWKAFETVEASTVDDTQEELTDISMDSDCMVPDTQIDEIGALRAEHPAEGIKPCYDCSSLTFIGSPAKNVAETPDETFIVEHMDSDKNVAVTSKFGFKSEEYTMDYWDKNGDKTKDESQAVAKRITVGTPDINVATMTVTIITKDSPDWDKSLFDFVANRYKASTIWRFTEKAEEPFRIYDNLITADRDRDESNDKCKAIYVDGTPSKRVIKKANRYLYESMDGNYYYVEGDLQSKRIYKAKITYLGGHCYEVNEADAGVKIIALEPQNTEMLDTKWFSTTRDDNGNWRQSVWDILKDAYFKDANYTYYALT